MFLSGIKKKKPSFSGLYGKRRELQYQKWFDFIYPLKIVRNILTKLQH